MMAETIAAPATPPGMGGVGIIRISGSGVPAIAAAVLGDCPPPRQAVLRHFRDGSGEALDHGIALYFPAPASFTGDDVLELQGHGGPVVMDRILERVRSLGARLARPGEFSERAFVNGRMDLTRAEAIADLIGSQSVEAARSAMRSLEGAFADRLHGVAEAAMALRVQVEALLDFPDEEITAELAACGSALTSLHEQLRAVRREAGSGRVLAEGLNTVILGSPNAGKSSLMNALTRRETAIVTEIPGTTRDILRETITLNGIPLHLMDTAGLHDTDDSVERAGIARAEEAATRADLILEVVDDSADGGSDNAQLEQIRAAHGPQPWLRLYNKIDRSGRLPGRVAGEVAVAVSARSGAGLDELARVVAEQVGCTPDAGSFLARQRHVEALDEAMEAVARAEGQWRGANGLELVADDLSRAHRAIGTITGEVTSEDLLGAIFSSFCIGK